MIPYTFEENKQGSYESEDEIDLRQLFSTLLERKYTVLITALLVMMVAGAYLYMKPTTYKSFALIDVKTQKSAAISPAMMFEGFTGFTNDEIDKELALYQTFSINEKVLERVALDVQYFVKKDLKSIEFYNDSPIKVLDLEIHNKMFFPKNYRIIPVDTLSFLLEESSDDILSWFEKPVQTKYRYGEKVQVEGMDFVVSKKSDFEAPIILKFNGEKRAIYENIVKKNLSIARADQKSSLIKISYTDSIPARAEAYVNTLANIFSSQNVSDKSEQNSKILVSIDSQLDEIRAFLKGAENEIEAYKVSENIVKPSEQADSLIDKLSKIDFQLTQAKLKYSSISKLEKSIRKGKNIDALSLSLSELGNPKISSLFEALQMAQLEENELKMDFKESFPRLKKVKLKIAMLKKQIVANIRSLKSTLSNQIKGLKDAKTSAEVVLKTLPEKERKLVNYNRNYEVNAKMYTYLLQLKAEKTIAQSSILSDFKVVDEAYTDLGSAKPKKTLVLVVALLTGLILGVFLAFIKEFFDDRIKDVSSIENYTSLPIFGFVPFIVNNKHKLEVLENGTSSFSESFREIRNNIRATYGANKSNMILVTSTVPTEGKTMTSVNLAGVLSLANYKCVVINLDLRKPVLHTHFDIFNFHGVSSYLEGKDSLDKIIHKTKYKGLDVIPAGPIPHNPSELLLRRELHDLLTYLKSHYDYIILDSAPVGLVSDSLELLNSVDLTLYVMRDGISKKGFVKNVNRLVNNNNLDNVSIIINGIKNGDYGYGYGYGYGYNVTA